MSSRCSLSSSRFQVAYSIRDSLALALRISRFRFWIYAGGTYVVGFALAADSLSDFFAPEYYLYLFYFFVPANIFIYGVNDYWDEATDRKNPKKDEKEYRVRQSDRFRLKVIILVVTITSVALMFFQDATERLVFGAFLLLSYFYSAGPARLKSRPVLDSASNVLYLMPGIFGFYLASGEFPTLPILAAGFMHTSAMHLFSAVPDIVPDRDAGIKTTAVVLGRDHALVACLSMWLAFAGLVLWLADYHMLSFLALVYPSIPLVLLLARSLSVDRLYWYLPSVNTALGGLLFTILVGQLL